MTSIVCMKIKLFPLYTYDISYFSVFLLQSLTAEERFAIIRSIGEECIQDDELLNLLKFKASPVCYDGFEPSGRMHIAQVMTMFVSATLIVNLFIRTMMLLVILN